MKDNNCLPGTPDAFGSLCTYFICSMRDSPLTQSFWHSGQHAGLGPPTRAVCCKAIQRKKAKTCSFYLRQLLSDILLQYIQEIIFSHEMS